MKMTIKELNVIFVEKGREAAFVVACAAEMDEWILERIYNGTWDPDFSEKKKSLEIARLVDKNGGNSLFSVKHAKTGALIRYEIHSLGGHKRSLGKEITLADARLAIGKVIVPPAFNGHGQKTNLPKEGKKKKVG